MGSLLWVVSGQSSRCISGRVATAAQPGAACLSPALALPPGLRASLQAASLVRLRTSQPSGLAARKLPTAALTVGI